MSVCEFFLAINLSLGGACEEAPARARGLPETEPAVFDYKRPPEPEPVVAKPPAPKIIMAPPVIIEKEVSKEAPPRTIIKKEYITVEKIVQPPKRREPDPFELELQAAQRARWQGQSTISAGGIAANGAAANVPGLAGAAPGKMAAVSADVQGALAAPEGQDRENSAYKAPKRISTSAVDNSRIFAADRYITGIVEAGVNSQLAEEGSVVIQTSENAFGYHGANILIPKGTRMTCQYSSVKKVGQTRLGFTCERVLLAQSRAELYQLGARVGDAQGYAGLSGHVDNRWWEKYGSAVMTVGIGAAVETAVSLSSRLEKSNSDTVASALSGISENIGDLSAKLLEDAVDLKPVIRISQGTRVQIRPDNDWYFPKPTQ